MFFLIRSAVCIGLVVSALPEKPGVDETDVPSALLGRPVAAMARLCREDPAPCRAALEGVLAGAAGTVPAGPFRPAEGARAAPTRRTTHPLVHTPTQVL